MMALPWKETFDFDFVLVRVRDLDFPKADATRDFLLEPELRRPRETLRARAPTRDPTPAAAPGRDRDLFP